MSNKCPYCDCEYIVDIDGYLFECEKCRESFNEDEFDWCIICGSTNKFCECEK